MIFFHGQNVEVRDPLNNNRWVKTTIDCLPEYKSDIGWICVASFRKGHVGPVSVRISDVRVL